MNIIHSKIRNRLTLEQVNKLLYTQINRRTLNRDIIIKKKDEKKEKATEEEIIMKDVKGEELVLQREKKQELLEAPMNFLNEELLGVSMSSQDELQAV
jgi:hypothetical protein